MEVVLKYILCHGSGNRFALIDGVEFAELLPKISTAEFVREAVQALDDRVLDGVLFLVKRRDNEYEMRMFNSDGSYAEMCGNGIRCVARLVSERYSTERAFTLHSGGRNYPIRIEEPIFNRLATFGVDIAITFQSKDFALNRKERIAERIPELDKELKFMFLNPGNPHIVAQTESIDFGHLTKLGERVKELKEIFPNGVNVSLYRQLDRQRIFVATYERGVGLTESCGTAMTSSATASVILGRNSAGENIEVINRGGAVRCCVKLSESGEVCTQLTGNATYYAEGTLSWMKGGISILEQSPIKDEDEEYRLFLRGIKE